MEQYYSEYKLMKWLVDPVHKITVNFDLLSAHVYKPHSQNFVLTCRPRPSALTAEALTTTPQRRSIWLKNRQKETGVSTLTDPCEMAHNTRGPLWDRTSRCLECCTGPAAPQSLCGIESSWTGQGGEWSEHTHICMAHTRTHMRAHTHTRARAHTHTHTHTCEFYTWRKMISC